MDLIITALALVVVGVIVALRDTISPGFSAVSLTQIISITGYMKLLIMFWTQLETSLGAVMRIQQFIQDNPKENSLGTERTHPPDWPKSGSISVRDATVVYPYVCSSQVSRSVSNSPSSGKTPHIALKSVTLNIKAGEKIGICGRTGRYGDFISTPSISFYTNKHRSGKTTFALSLLKMVDLDQGQIFIDGIDIVSTSTNDLRSCLTVIPDDPFFMPGSIRTNIDPYGTATDEQIRYALKAVLLSNLSEEQGFDGELKPDDLSHGQKQLFALARAMLSPQKKIVLLDEATSRYAHFGYFRVKNIC